MIMALHTSELSLISCSPLCTSCIISDLISLLITHVLGVMSRPFCVKALHIVVSDRLVTTQMAVRM